MLHRLLLLLPLLSPLAQASASVERRLYVDRADSSSFLWNDWNKFQENYHPLYAADGDPATAWVEGASGTGVGEWLRMPVTPLNAATNVRLRVRNGYQKSTTLYKANARAKDVTVTLQPSGTTAKLTFTDTEGFQELTITQPAGALESVEIRVDSVYAGTKYQDLCISDVEIFATAATTDNPVAEKAKLDRLLVWKASRVAAAKLFQTVTAGQMPIAPAYSLRVERGYQDTPYPSGNGPFGTSMAAVSQLVALTADPLVPTPADGIALALGAYASNFAGWTAVQAVPSDTREIPQVDGLAPTELWNCYEGAPVWLNTGGTNGMEAAGALELPTVQQIGFLRSDGLGTFAATDAPTIDQALASTPSACIGRDPHTFAWAKSTPATASTPAQLQALFTISCGEVDSREGTERVSQPQLLVYGEGGRLALLVGREYATAFAWRADGAVHVISEARRVGMSGDVIRMSEASATASR